MERGDPSPKYRTRNLCPTQALSRVGSGGPGNVSGGAAGTAGTMASLGLVAAMRRVDTGMLGSRERLVLGDKAGRDTC